MVREPRSIPVIQNRSSKALRKREKKEVDYGCFGRGTLREALVISEPSQRIGRNAQVDEGDNSLKTAIHLKMINEAIQIVAGMQRMKDLLADATFEERAAPIFQESIVTCSNLTGLHLDVNFMGDNVDVCVPPSDTPIVYSNPHVLPEMHDNPCKTKTMDLNAADEPRDDATNDIHADEDLFDMHKTTDFGGNDFIGVNDDVSSGSMGDHLPMVNNEKLSNDVTVIEGVLRLPLCSLDNNLDYGLNPSSGEGFGKAKRKKLPQKSSKLKSPFIQREVCPSKRLSKQEKEVALYNMYSETFNRSDKLFRHKEVELNRYEMQSLRKGTIVDQSIINAWCVLLNNHENIRASYSPMRFFSSTNIYNQFVHGAHMLVVQQQEAFKLAFASELSMYHSAQLDLIDIIFFPIFDEQRYYGIALDMKKWRMFVLDSMFEESSNDSASKYEIMCNNLRVLLESYMNSMGHEQRSRLVGKSKMQVVKMKSAANMNIEDTSVYLMRHLETFMGDGSISWVCSTSISTIKQLRIV